MKVNPKKRLYIYPKDVERITGRNLKWCRNLIIVIRLLNNKKKHQGVTVDEFCEYMGLEKDEVEAFL